MTLNDATREQAERLLGHTFNDPTLLVEALTHASAADTRLRSNERMEFLGDAVLDLVVCEELYRMFPEHFEGELTKIKSAVVSRRTCAVVARTVGLDALFIVGKGVDARDARTGATAIPSSLAANVYESVVAALYLDGGFETARRFVRETMAPHIKAVAANLHQHNYKAMLQQHAQKLLGGTPQYELLDEKGPDHSKCFEVCVAVNGRRFEGAWGPNKKTAEQKAALLALRELEAVDPAEADALLEQLGLMEMQAAEQVPG